MQNDPDDPGLQRSLAAWLQSIGAELLARLRNTCTYITDWSQNLVRPLKRAKRNFDIQEMTVSIKVLPQPQDSSSHSRTTDRSNICPGDHSPASAGGSVAMSRTETILSSLDLQTFTADDDYGYQSLPSILDVTEMAAGDASDMHYRDISLYSPYGSPWTNQTIRLQAPNYLLPGDGSNSEIEVFHNVRPVNSTDLQTLIIRCPLLRIPARWQIILFSAGSCPDHQTKSTNLFPSGKLL